MFVATTSAEVTSSAQNRFRNLRQALNDCADLYAWSSAHSQADLEALGYSVEDAELILSACADANQMAALYGGGGLGTYPADFNFGASQRQIIGP